MNWPLSAKVIANVDGRGILATVFKHWREHPYSCSVLLLDYDQVIDVPFSRLFLVDTDRRGERPWWKALK